MSPRRQGVGRWELRLKVSSRIGSKDGDVWEITLRHEDDHPDACSRLISAGDGVDSEPFAEGCYRGALEALRSVVALDGAR